MSNTDRLARHRATPPGAAHVFVRSNGVWSERQKLVASDDGETNSFGDAFSLSGDTLAVAAPGDHQERGAVYVFVRNTFGAWNEQQKVTASDGLTGDLFGLAIALSGRTLLVGARGDDVGPNPNQGSAYVFELSDGVWIQRQKLTASDGVAGDGLGFSVALRANQLFLGTHLDTVAGQAFQGSVRVFSESPAQERRSAGGGLYGVTSSVWGRRSSTTPSFPSASTPSSSR